MMWNSYKRLIILGTICFLFSRLIIIYGYKIYFSDVILYYETAYYGIEKGLHAYRNFWYPYPPLSLPFLYFPMYLVPNLDFHNYRRIFQFEMFFFDILCLIYLILFMKNRLHASPKKIFSSIIVYSGLGLLTGHLIYDRFDIIIGLIAISSLYHITSPKLPKQTKFLSYFFIYTGALIKIVPILWLPILTTIEIRLTKFFPNYIKNLLLYTNIKKFISILFPGVIVTILFLASILIYHNFTYNPRVKKGLITFLEEQNQRSIQIESTWAMPMMLKNFFDLNKGKKIRFHIVTEYGAQHFPAKELNKTYLMLAKYSDFITIGFVYIFIFILCLFNEKYNTRLYNNQWLLLYMYTSIILFISLHRVFSPQYLIWIIPGISALICSDKNNIGSPLLILSASVYIFTFIGFDIGYDKYRHLDRLFIMVVFFRNILIIVTAIYLLKHLLFLPLCSSHNTVYDSGESC